MTLKTELIGAKRDEYEAVPAQRLEPSAGDHWYYSEHSTYNTKDVPEM